MVTETRPGEPGASGRAGGSLLERMNAAVQPATGRLGTVRQTDAKVLSAQFIGTDANGDKVYKVAIRSGGRTNYITRSWNGDRFLKPRAMKGTRSTPTGSGRGSGSSAGEGSGTPALDQAKDRWLTQIANMNLPDEVKSFLSGQIENFRGSPMGLSNMVEQQLSFRVGPAPNQDNIDPDAGLGGGGGFGGGFSGPTYVAPDRRVVEDFVTGALVSLIGGVPDDEMVGQFADLYMTDHRRNFDNEGEEIDPSQSVKEAIRGTEHYQQIHALRPESEDERNWVAQRRQAAAQGGLTTGQQEDFAITQASVGGDLPDVADAAAQRQFRTSGSTRGTLLEDKVRGVAKSMFARVR